MKSIVVYLPEGFADWEGAFLLPELRETQRSVTIVSESGEPVLSIGGLRVHVDKALSAVSSSDIEALVLIGSDSWVKPDKNTKVLALAKDLLQRGTLVAAICGATAALGRVGLLDERKHTSNDLEFLKYVAPAYRNEKNYVEKLAVRDGNLITASGVGALEFTMEVMTALGVHSEEKRRHWFALYKNGVKPPREFWS